MFTTNMEAITLRPCDVNIKTLIKIVH